MYASTFKRSEPIADRRTRIFDKVARVRKVFLKIDKNSKSTTLYRSKMNVHVRAEWARKISILFVISGTRGHKLIFNRGAEAFDYRPVIIGVM